MKPIFSLLAAVVFLIYAPAEAFAQRAVRAPSPAPRSAPAPHFVPTGSSHHNNGGGGGTGSDIDPVATIALIIGIVIVVFVIVLVVRSFSNQATPAAWIRITQLPPGEAPEAIRRAWIGVELPLRRGRLEPCRVDSASAVSLHGQGVAYGFAVNGARALKALEVVAPDAAVWWRSNAPHVTASGFELLFPVNVCERVPT